MAQRISPAIEAPTDGRLLHALAEDLKRPLVTIAYRAELAKATGNVESFDDIILSSRSALQMVDTLLLGYRSSIGQLELELEPMAASALLQDVAHQLSPLAKKAGVELEYHAQKSHHLAMLHPRALVGSMTTLGTLLIDAIITAPNNRTLQLRSYVHEGSPRLSVTGSVDAPTTKGMLERARKLYGGSVNTGSSVFSFNSSGVFIAEQLLHAMKADLSVISHGELHGFSARLQQSNQISLV